ncbi:hypothetical protein CLV32_3189 [Pedobacter duraquae]|uniref:Uncharacterized protein n=1 Tax=Pedobacter duraquae TaxID=425511 RepID=A0A4R6IJG4_9SPHI|nr:hypothetical protein CLV32_3189 [Pedobacter duraquae]
MYAANPIALVCLYGVIVDKINKMVSLIYKHYFIV